MSDAVLDASAVLAVLNDETGATKVEQLLPGAIMSTVNAAEVAAKLVDAGAEPRMAIEFIQRLGLRLMPFLNADIETTARLRKLSRAIGLSLGDRACLALAMREGLPALTADRGWSGLDIGVEVRLIRGNE